MSLADIAISVAATWIGPTTPLEPRFLPSLPIKSIIPSTEIAVKIPSTVSIITNENYVPSFTADDISDIKTSLVVNLGVDEASEYGQAEREELVMKKGCENCGKLAASLRCKFKTEDLIHSADVSMLRFSL